MTAMKKGTPVRERPVVPFSGVILDYDVDKENGNILYLVAQVEKDEKTGNPKMVEARHGDSADHDAEGKPLFEKDGVTPKDTGELVNVRTEMVPVVHSRWMREQDIELDPATD